MGILLQIQTYTTFEPLQAEWNDLLRRSATDDIFLTWEWQSTWWDVYQEGQLAILACRDETGRLIGIAPLYEVDGVCCIVGGKDVTDYLDFLIDQESIPQVLQAYAQHFKQNQLQLDLVNLPANSPTLTQLADAITSIGGMVETTSHEVCPLIVLPEDWEGYLALLDKRQRHELRRKMRRAMGGEEEIAMFTVDESHNLQEMMERFTQLMAASDPQKALFLQNEQHVTFFQRFAALALQNKWLCLRFLTVDGQDAAAYLDFDYNNRILVYNSGLALDVFSHLSPGIVLLANNIQHAIDNKYAVFDFLRGNESYKYSMGAKDTHIYRMTATFE
jgi:CelD/BcsL family acetyltransferase involved in cellulose biosynthesis